MGIQVKLYGPLEKYGDRGEVHFAEIKPGWTIEQLLDCLRIPRPAIGFITVNGCKALLTYRLQENDVIKVFPHVSGG
ncbi:MAG: MoaD/ThiS family protein [Bacillota bacterium]